jgi:hypothetical protein
LVAAGGVDDEAAEQFVASEDGDFVALADDGDVGADVAAAKANEVAPDGDRTSGVDVDRVDPCRGRAGAGGLGDG